MTEDIRRDLAALQREVRKLENSVENLRERTVSGKVWDFILKLSIPVILVVSGKLVAHEVSLSSIQSTRFTAQEARQLERQLEESAQRLVAESEARIAKALGQMPPEWLRELVNELKTGQKDILSRLTVVETKLENGNK